MSIVTLELSNAKFFSMNKNVKNKVFSLLKRASGFNFLQKKFNYLLFRRH